MDAALTKYEEILERTKAFYLTSSRIKLERDFYRLFAQFLLDLTRREGTAPLTPASAVELERWIKARLTDLTQYLHTQINGGSRANGTLRDAAELVTNGHLQATTEAAALAGVSYSANYDRIPERTLRLMIMRSQAEGLSESFRSLLPLRTRELAGDIDTFLVHMVATGESWQSSTTRLAKILSRDNASVLDALGQLGPRGGRLRRFLKAEPLPEVDLKQAKQLLHRSRRIVITETNQAYHTSDIVASAASPVVLFLVWTLSGRHAGLPSSPDVCDLIALHDAGYGPGHYPPEICPSLLHPYCLCTTRKVLRPASQWRLPKPPIARPQGLSRDAAETMLLGRAGDRVPTSAFVRAQWQRANRKIFASYTTYQELADVGS